jgi:hypothetical protein
MVLSTGKDASRIRQGVLDIMAKKVQLLVNHNPITLDYFVHEYLEKVVSGIIASLNDTGEIERLELIIDESGQVSIHLNNAEVTLKEFPVQIIRSTIEGILAPLKGVEGVISRVEIKIES